MINAIINNLPTTPCAHSICEGQTAEANPSDARNRPEKADQVRISEQARERLKSENANTSSIKSEADLSEEEKRAVEKMKQRDQEVKAHERAHMAAGSGVVLGGATYEYTQGPDGKMYAVGGEVKIDTSKENSPEATIRKMQQVKRAALAPAQPSAQDRSVAATAAQIEAEARIELQQEKAEAAEEESHHSQGLLSGINTNPLHISNESQGIGYNLDIMA